MNRKFVYSALGLPIVVAAVSLAMVPAHTRSIFLTEFKHRFLGTFFEEPEQPLEGLRRQNPEEYGPQPGAGEVASGVASESSETETDELASDVTETDVTETDELESSHSESASGLDSDVDENENP
jgi:hypothetical protein